MAIFNVKWKKVLDVILGINEKVVNSKSEVPSQTTNTKNFITVQNNNTQNNNITNPSTTKTNNKVLVPTVQVPTTQNSQISPIYANAQKTIAPLANTEYKLSKSTKEAKEIKSGDMYKLTEGKIDDRTTIQKAKDDVVGVGKKATDTILGVGGNLLMGAESAVSNTADYVDSAMKDVTKGLTEYGIKKTLGHTPLKDESINNITEIIAPIIGNEIYETIGKKTSANAFYEANRVLNNEEMDKWRSETIQSNIDKSAGKIGKYLAEIAPGIGQNLVNVGLRALNPTLGTITFMTSAGGSYLDDARARGMDEDSAMAYATVMGGIEGLTESVISDKTIKAGSTLLGAKEVTKEIIEKVSKTFGFSIAENFAQELAIEPLSEATAQITAGEEYADWDNIVQRSLKSGFDGAVSAVLLSGLSAGVASAGRVYNKMRNGQNVTQGEIIETINDIKEAGINVDEIAQQNLQTAVQLGIQQATQNEQTTQQNTNISTEDIAPYQASQETVNTPVRELNYEESAKKYNINTNNETIQTINKVTQERGINARFDADLFVNNNANAIWRVSTDANGNTTREVVLNPNADSKKTLQSVIVHELTHDLEGTTEYNDLKDLILSYDEGNIGFENARKSLEELYSKVYDKNSKEFKSLVENEVVADILGNKLGEQEFITNLTMEKPSTARKIYNWVIDKLNKINKLTGYSSEKLFWTDIKNKFENAYRQDYQGNNKDTRHSIHIDSDGNQYVKVDTDQDIFKGIEEKDYSKIAKMYMQDYLKGKTILNKNDTTTIGSKGINKYTNPKQQTKYISEKMQLTPELKNVLEIAEKVSDGTPTKDTTKFPNWEYYKFKFELGGKFFEGLINIGVNKNGNKHFYEINKIHTTSNSHVSASKSSSTDFINNSIPSQNEDVNTTTKYSMQESENNSELSEEAKKQLHRYVNMDKEELEKAFSDAVDNKENMLIEYNNFQKEYKELQNTQEFKNALNDFVSSETPKQETTEIMNKANKYADKLRYYNEQYKKYKAQQDAINSILMGNEIDTRSIEQIVNDAENHFGTTKNFKETGYIDINGSQIDFSGKHEGGSPGFRAVDHRQINEIDIDMDSFINIGNIRLIPEGGGINLKIEPNLKQYNKLREYIDSVDGEIYIDIDKTKYTYDSAEYKKGTSTNKIISDLQYYFKNGEFPKQSELAQFRYSISKNSQIWQSYLDKNYKNTGKGETIEDVKIPIREDTNLNEKQSDIAPIVQNNELGENIAPVGEQQGKIAKKIDDENLNEEQERAAKIMKEMPTPENKQQRLWAKFVLNFVDKSSPFEDLSIKTKNRKLIAKWDYILTAEARAQNVMMNGTYEYDSTNKERTQVSKSLEDIRTEVGDDLQEFSQYLYHKLNIDRMTLDSRFGIDNKPVFGDTVTVEISQRIIEQYENNNPEFMDWAKDVYDYNKANLNQLVKSGVISQETADFFGEVYPHYVPISRANVRGNAINVPLDTNRTGINVPIKKAKGGNQDILPLFDTMARRTLQTYKAVAKNNFGVELKNTLNSVVENQQTDVDEVLENVDQQEELLKEGKNGREPTFTVFENGEKVTYEITKDMYDALKPISESSILNTTFKPFNAIGNFQRGVLTEYNPVFMLTNAIKDVQDVLLNSQHAAKTYAKLGEAYAQIIKKGYWYEEYMANGGEQNSYFNSQDSTFDTKKGISKVSDIFPLKKISELNNLIEMSPRLAEYIASREAGRSIETSMLDAARVTTNFKAGGDVTKWANRNGATFLNASVQGALQQVRNVREANMNGLKGYANLATKFTLAGLPAIILNSLLWSDDEEYEELSDYVKTNYWIVGKYGDGNFIRIPKGRMVTVIQESFNQMKHLITGDEEADLGQFLEVMGSNLAPNNPVESNVLSPIIQATTNTTWYGDDLVPSRLQNVPAEEQYDESIDKLSIAIGQKTGISPYKINYVLDQYSGGIGDIVLPMLTEQAEGGNDSLGSKLIAPLVDKFTVDSTMKNQNVSDLYTLSDEITTKANSSKATDEEVLQNKYLNAVKTEMNELYKEKREIQSDTSLSDSEKYNQVREIQEEINNMAKEATEKYKNVTVKSNYSTVGGKEYYKNSKGEWTSVREEAKDLKELGMTATDKNTYFKTKNEISKIVSATKDSKEQITIDDEDSEEYKNAVNLLSSEKKQSIVNKIVNSGLKDNEKAYLYKKFYNSDTIDTMINANINVDDYLTYTTMEFKSDYNSNGKAITNSRKNKVTSYVNSLKLNIPQKAILIKSTNTFKFNDYNNDIIKYVKGLKIDYADKVKILEDLDMTVADDGTVTWKK